MSGQFDFRGGNRNGLTRSPLGSSQNGKSSLDLDGSRATLDRSDTSLLKPPKGYNTFSDSELTLDRSHDVSMDLSHDVSRDLSHDVSRDLSHDMSRDLSHDFSRDLSYEHLDRSAESHVAGTESEATLVADADDADDVEGELVYSASEQSLAFTNSSLAYTVSEVELVTGWLEGKTPLGLASSRSTQVRERWIAGFFMLNWLSRRCLTLNI